MKGQIKVGMVVGTGAALNVKLGWIPDFVEVFNVTDGDLVTSAFLGWVVPFSSGGTAEIKTGDTIVGATSGATAIVTEVVLSSGTWAGGDAAGFFSVRSLTGTFGSENVKVGAGTNDATVTANVVHNVAFAAAAASATGIAALSRFEGVEATDARGFTIGSTVSESAKLLRYVAYRADQ